MVSYTYNFIYIYIYMYMYMYIWFTLKNLSRHARANWISKIFTERTDLESSYVLSSIFCRICDFPWPPAWVTHCGHSV